MEITSEPSSLTASDVSINNLPTEILFVLFKLFPPKEMVRSRQVCVRWRDVIDALLIDGNLWEKYCRHDFRKVYKQAMRKTLNITNWFEMYRSLSLWSLLSHTRETIDEFCHSDTIDDEMRSAIVQEKGVVMVHKRTRVVYHDLLTLRVSKRKGFAGQFTSFIELEDIVVMLGMNGQLHVVNKPYHDWSSNLTVNTDADDEIVFYNVGSFIVEDRMLFYTTYHNDLYVFHLDSDKTASLVPIPEPRDGIPDGICALGYTDGCLYILTMSQRIYMYVNEKVFLKFTLDSITNLMNCLYQHNMLENLDWRHYYILLSHLSLKRHTGLLQYISKMQIYGDLFFVGTQSGIVIIYYRPFKNGQLDLTEFEPVKIYNFTNRIDIPVLSVYPILNIEVTETKDGHNILVCMPRKILVITYRYNFEKPVSKAVLPYVGVPALSVQNC